MFAAGDPGHRRRLRTGGDSADGDLCAGVVQGTGRRRTGERGYPPARQTGGTDPSWPIPDVP